MVKGLQVGGGRALCKLKRRGQSDSHAVGEVSEFPSQRAEYFIKDLDLITKT